MVSVRNKSFLFCHMFKMQLQLIKEVGHASVGGQWPHCTFHLSKTADSSRYVPLQVTNFVVVVVVVFLFCFLTSAIVYLFLPRWKAGPSCSKHG